jgi:hypothetical protein
MYDAPRTCRTPSLCGLSPSCAWYHSTVERTPVSLGGGNSWGQLTPYNWLKAWNAQGLIGLLGGHQGGAPAKFTPQLLDTAEQVARASPCTLAQIDRRLREIHPDAPPFSLDCLSANLKKRGLSFCKAMSPLNIENFPEPHSTMFPA